MMCRHLGMLANQGVTWCGLNKSAFPQCETCEYFEKSVDCFTTTTDPISETTGLPISKEDFLDLLSSKDIIKGVGYLTTEELQEIENKLYSVTNKHYRVVLDYENFGDNTSYYTLRAEENEEPETDYNVWDNYTR